VSQTANAATPVRPTWARTPFVLAALAVLICLRMPQIVLKGRFWAEEGTIFFQTAWQKHPLDAMLLVFGGYLNLPANLGALGARWLMPLPLAPYITIGLSLAVMLCPAFLLLTARDTWLRHRTVTVAAIGLITLIPDSEEVWLQTLHCQFHLLLACGIILALQTESNRIELFRRALLFLAPLCGPVSIALLPLFALRAVIDRSLPRLMQCLCLIAGAAIQLTFFFTPVPGRAYALDPVTFLCAITIRHLYEPFFGVAHTETMSALIRARLKAGYIPLKATIIPALALAPFAALCWRQRAKTPAPWLLAAFFTVAAATYFGALGGTDDLLAVRTDGRYTFAPQALLALSILALAAGLQGRAAWAAYTLVAWLLTAGAWAYTHPWPYIADGPAWPNQIKSWRQNPTRPILLWPTGWSLSLNPQNPNPRTLNPES